MLTLYSLIPSLCLSHSRNRQKRTKGLLLPISLTPLRNRRNTIVSLRSYRAVIAGLTRNLREAALREIPARRPE